MATGFLVAVIIFVWGVGSLLLVAIKTKSFETVFLKKPSIIFGDVFILPFIAGLSAYNLQHLNQVFLDFNQSSETAILLIVGFVLALVSAIRNQLTGIWWLPHILFYWFIAYLVLSFLIKRFDLTSIIWWTVLFGISIHQLLGIIFPKRFPKV